MRKLACLLAITSLVSGVFLLAALTASHAFAEGTADEMYAKGTKTLQIGSGALFGPAIFGTDRQTLDYAMTFLRAGYFLTGPTRKDFFPRGNLEGIMQVSGSAVTKGFGNYMAEFAVLFRYNFVNPEWRLVPYWQVGAGILYNDLYKDQSQDIIGQAVEFTPQTSVGFRYLLSKGWSFDLEMMFHHISNAGLASRNMGSNALGGFIGVTHFFGPSK